MAVSARTGEGLDELKNELRRLSLEAPPKPADLPFRLPIDRSFVMKGFGAVVTGTLITGTVEKEAEVEIFPLGKRARVRGIEVYNASADRATAGQRTALNLAGTEARQITRGMVLAAPGLFQPTTSLDCTLSLLPSARPLKNHAQVHFHCGTAEMLARVVLLEGKEMKPGATGFVQFRLSEPGLFVPGDRFIIRQFSPVTTIGGGGVLDNAPPKHRAGDPATTRIFARTGTRRTGSADRTPGAGGRVKPRPQTLAARTGWKPCGCSPGGKFPRKPKAAGAPWATSQPAGPCGALRSDWRSFCWSELRKVSCGKSAGGGTAQGGIAGQAADRRQRPHSLPSPTLLNALLQSLIAQGKIDVQGEMVRLGGRTIQLSAEEIAARDQIAAAFEKAGLAVPTRAGSTGNPAPRPRARREITEDAGEGKCPIKVTEDLIFHRSALRELREILARRKTQNNRLGVTDFKELTGLSRKYAIPLLEYLDRERVTRREGDERIIL